MAAAAEHEHVPPDRTCHPIRCVTHIHRRAWDDEKGTLPLYLLMCIAKTACYMRCAHRQHG